MQSYRLCRDSLFVCELECGTLRYLSLQASLLLCSKVRSLGLGSLSLGLTAAMLRKLHTHKKKCWLLGSRIVLLFHEQQLSFTRSLLGLILLFPFCLICCCPAQLCTRNSGAAQHTTTKKPNGLFPFLFLSRSKLLLEDSVLIFLSFYQIAMVNPTRRVLLIAALAMAAKPLACSTSIQEDSSLLLVL